MLKLYTTVGSYNILTDKYGKRFPAVISNGKEHILSDEETIIWSELLWNIFTAEEIETRYRVKANAYGICSDAPFSYHLSRLEQRELIVSGSDIVGVDAVYNLLSNLFVVPISSTFFDRVFVFAKMLIRGVPAKVARGVFAKVSVSEAENKVLALAKKQLMSTAELIRCSTLDDPDLSSQDAMVSSIYSIDNLNSDNIAIFSKFSEMQEPVTSAVAKLYLKQKVMFEKYA